MDVWKNFFLDLLIMHEGKKKRNYFSPLVFMNGGINAKFSVWGEET